MTAPAWYVLPFAARRESSPGTLPAGAPLAAQYLNAALPLLAPVIRSDIAAGRVNSRRVRTALAQLAEVLPVRILPSRAEMERAHRYLAQGGHIVFRGEARS